MDLQEFEQHFRAIFGRDASEIKADLDDAKARLLTVENWATSHAKYADAVLEAVETLAATVDPAEAAEVNAAVTAAKELAAEAHRLLDDVIAKM
jgi:hypothetical protein